MAGLATDPAVDVAVVRNASPIVHSILALILLLIATVLGVYKPFGMTAYGRRKHNEQRQAFAPAGSAPILTADAVQSRINVRWVYVAGIIAVALVLVFVVLHLTGSAFQH